MENLNRALGTQRNIIHPLNLFMNTKVNADGKITICKPISKGGDKVVLRALMDCAVGISACSVSEADTNSGICTAIAVEIA